MTGLGLRLITVTDENGSFHSYKGGKASNKRQHIKESGKCLRHCPEFLLLFFIVLKIESFHNSHIGNFTYEL